MLLVYYSMGMPCKEFFIDFLCRIYCTRSLSYFNLSLLSRLNEVKEPGRIQFVFTFQENWIFLHPTSYFCFAHDFDLLDPVFGLFILGYCRNGTVLLMGTHTLKEGL